MSRLLNSKPPAAERYVEIIVAEYCAPLKPVAMANRSLAAELEATIVIVQAEDETDDHLSQRVREKVGQLLTEGYLVAGAQYLLSTAPHPDRTLHRIALVETLMSALCSSNASEFTLGGQLPPNAEAEIDFWKLVECVAPLAAARNAVVRAIPWVSQAPHQYVA